MFTSKCVAETAVKRTIENIFQTDDHSLFIDRK